MPAAQQRGVDREPDVVPGGDRVRPRPSDLQLHCQRQELQKRFARGCAKMRSFEKGLLRVNMRFKALKPRGWEMKSNSKGGLFYDLLL